MDATMAAIDPCLASYWWYEHLLCLPDVDTEVVTHFGERLKQLPAGNMPASLAARLFLRHILNHSMALEELLSILSMFQHHSEQQQHFQTSAGAQMIQPPDALLVEVLQQNVVSYCLRSFQQGQALQAITQAVHQQALHILRKNDLQQLLESEQLKRSLDTLQYVLGGLPQPKTLEDLQQLLETTFPRHLMDDHVQQFAQTAWDALGPSSLQVFQRATLSGQLPFHPFLNFINENEDLQQQAEQPTQQQQGEQAAAAGPAVAETPGGEPLIVGGQQQELVIPDSTDPAAANRLTQPSSTPGIPSPRTGSDPAPAVIGKQQRRIGDPAAAAVRGQLNLLPSTAFAARNQANHPQQHTVAVGEENTPPEEQAAVLQALIKTQAQAAAAAKQQQQLGRGVIQPPRPLASAAALPVATWEEQVMGRYGGGIAWGGDRRKLKNDKLRAEKQQTAEERARRKAERELLEAQQKAARNALREQEKARREAERKAAEEARRAEAKAARAKLRQEKERRKEVERELAKLQRKRLRDEAKAAKQAEAEEQKQKRAETRKAARAAGKKVESESENEMEIPSSEDEEEFLSIDEDSSSEDVSSDSEGWSEGSSSVEDPDSDESDEPEDHSSRPPAAAAAARRAGRPNKNTKQLPQAQIKKEQTSGTDSDQQGPSKVGQAASRRGRKRSKQAAAAAAAAAADHNHSDDLFADLQVDSDDEGDQPAAAGSRKRKSGKASEEHVAAAAAEPSKKRKIAAAPAAEAGDGQPASSEPDAENLAGAAAAAPADKAPKKQQQSSKTASAAAAAGGPAKQGLCGRGGGPKTGAVRTVQWDTSASEPADEQTAESPGCQGPQSAAELRAHIAQAREKNGGVSLAAAMRQKLESAAQAERIKELEGDMSSDDDDEEEEVEEPRERGRRGANRRQAAAAIKQEADGDEPVDGSGGDIYEYVVNGSDEAQQRRKSKKKKKKRAAAAAAAAAAGDSAAPGPAAAAGDSAAPGPAEAAGEADTAAPAAGAAVPNPSSGNAAAAAAATESKPAGRRKAVRWSKEEEELLEELVGEYGAGKWAVIKDAGSNTFLPHRTAVDLKDKWRNIQKSRGEY